MRAIVTGSKGFIGSHLLRHLEQFGHETFGLDKDDCDLADLEKVKSVIKSIQPEAIFHLAAYLPSGQDEGFEKFFKSNVQTTFNLLESTKAMGPCRFIYSSTMNVYGKTEYLPVDEAHSTEPVNIYGLTKLLGEKFCRFYSQNFGYRVVVLRYSGVFGPGRDTGAIASFISKALKGEAIEIDSDGSDKWDALYVEDVVKANITALEKIDNINYEVFNIGNGKGLILKEVAEEIIRLARSSSKIKFMQKKGDINFYYDITKARETLKFVPCPFTERLKDFVAYKKSEMGGVYK